MAAGTLRTTRSGKARGFLGGGIGKSTIFGTPAFGVGSPGGFSAGGGSSGGSAGGARGGWAFGLRELDERREQKQAAAAGMSALAAAIGQHGKAFGEAKTANERRYEAMLRIADKERQRKALINQRMLGVAEQTTGQRAADIRGEGAEQEADIMQRLARVGMGGTTAAPTMREGVKRWTSEKLNRLADLMQKTKLDLMQRRADIGQGTRLGIMERREDEYPSSDVILALTKQLGGLPGVDYSALGRMRT